APVPAEVVGELRCHLIEQVTHIEGVPEVSHAGNRDRRTSASRLEAILGLAPEWNLEPRLVDRVSGKHAHELHSAGMRSVGKGEGPINQVLTADHRTVVRRIVPMPVVSNREAVRVRNLPVQLAEEEGDVLAERNGVSEALR